MNLLTKLDASNNPKITNVSHLHNLQELYASGNCGITDDGIKGLRLIELDATDNPKIKSKYNKDDEDQSLDLDMIVTVYESTSYSYISVIDNYEIWYNDYKLV